MSTDAAVDAQGAVGDVATPAGAWGDRAAAAAEPDPKLDPVAAARTTDDRSQVPIDVARRDKTVAEAILARTKIEAAQSIVEALQNAATDPVSQAKAKAEAEVRGVQRVADAEAMVKDAGVRLDAILLADALEAKNARLALEATQARVREAEAAAARDPNAVGNPFADASRPTITRSQYQALSVEGKARAAREGNIIDDPAPARLTIHEHRAVVGDGRKVISRDQFNALDVDARHRHIKERTLIVD